MTERIRGVMGQEYELFKSVEEVQEKLQEKTNQKTTQETKQPERTEKKMRISEIKTRLDQAGLSFEELLVLQMVIDMEDRLGDEWDVGISMMDVVELAHKSKLTSHATTFKYIQNLVNKNLVIKTTSDKDRRVTLVSATKAGRRLVDEING